jgi:hypothetical protein
MLDCLTQLRPVAYAGRSARYFNMSILSSVWERNKKRTGLPGIASCLKQRALRCAFPAMACGGSQGLPGLVPGRYCRDACHILYNFTLKIFFSLRKKVKGRFLSTYFLSYGGCSLIFADEKAHTDSTDYTDFRPSMLELKQKKNRLGMNRKIRIKGIYWLWDKRYALRGNCLTQISQITQIFMYQLRG